MTMPVQVRARLSVLYIIHVAPGPPRRTHEVVDGAGAVHGDVGDEAAFEEVDDLAVDAGADNVGTHEENDGGHTHHVL